MSFTPVPSLAPPLQAASRSRYGQTMFTLNRYTLAYDTLSEGMKRIVEGLHGIHTGTRKVEDPNSIGRRSRRRSIRRSPSRSCI